MCQLHLFDDNTIIPSLKREATSEKETTPSNTFFSAPDIDLSIYDHVIVCMSGGKDSIACLLHLFDNHIDRSKIELWHHDIDGTSSDLMDWSFMKSYNQKLADTFDLPLYFSWLDGGFEGELLKENSYSRPHHIETPDGLLVLERDKTRSKPGTRLKFPQVAASLQTRWCSSVLKIDVGRRALNNQSRFDGKKILFITGERRQESSNRSRYNQLESHACDRRNGRKNRLVDAWRPVLEWSEEQVWNALERHKIIAPVPYRLGWSRSSCMKCIFNNATIWSTLDHYFPGSLDKIAQYEEQFGVTISRNKKPILDLARSVPPLAIDDKEALLQATKKDYTLPVLQTSEAWQLPAGAYGKEGCGAT